MTTMKHINLNQIVGTTLLGQSIVVRAIGDALSQGAQEAQAISNQKVETSASVLSFQKAFVFLSCCIIFDDIHKEHSAMKKYRKTSRTDRKRYLKSRDWRKN